jgi:hypothetical protein
VFRATELPGRAHGVIVAPRSDFGTRQEDQEYIYVVGAAADFESHNYMELLMMAFDAAPQTENKEPRWEERWASHGGDVDWPVSLVERMHLGAPNIRRMVVGQNSTHPQSNVDMLTSVFEDVNP